MTEDDMKKRTKAYALRVIKVAEALPPTRLGNHIAGQLIRAGTSVPANYRAACRARSRAEFIAKLGIVEEEGDESIFWMEFAADAGLVKPGRIRSLIDEGNQILSIVVRSRKTARAGADALRQSQIKNRK